MSMTAFSRQQLAHSAGTLVCEIRTINHRFLESYVRLPEALYALDGAVRELLRAKIKRGKLECIVKFQPQVPLENFALNTALIEQVLGANRQVVEQFHLPNGFTSKDILQWPNVFNVAQSVPAEQLSESLLALIHLTLDDLRMARQREGQALGEFILTRLGLMEEEISKVHAKLPQILTWQREKLLTRFKEASVNLEPERLAQEMVILAQKIDVSEELARLAAHIQEVKLSLQKEEAMGRRLDFLMQELNREANTLGSKSIDTETTLSSVALKVYIEQMREQVQNIE